MEQARRSGGHRAAAGDRLRSPAALLAALGIESSAQIQVEAIAQFCGATVVYQPLEGSEARLIGFRDRAIITVNQSSPRSRQRFSAAHELGHWMWDRGKMAFSCGESLLDGECPDDTAERRANQYAADLLLPPALFRERAAGRDLSFSSVSELAGEFGTSFTATAIRLVELAARPCALVGEAWPARGWLVRSPPLRGNADGEARRSIEPGEGLAALDALGAGGRREIRRLGAHRTLILHVWN